jgi:thioesterase domain-containing protein
MSDHSALPAVLDRLQQRLQRMPPVRAMALQVEDFDAAHGLRLWAPLQANVNDKGSAFGGSLAGLMTLACWGSVTLTLDLAGCGEAEVYVQDSSVQYLAPLYHDLRAEATLGEGQRWEDLARTYRERGKARATLDASVRCADGRLAARLSGRFVALRPR